MDSASWFLVASQTTSLCRFGFIDQVVKIPAFKLLKSKFAFARNVLHICSKDVLNGTQMCTWTKDILLKIY
jgi:hypothetical protein